MSNFFPVLCLNFVLVFYLYGSNPEVYLNVRISLRHLCIIGLFCGAIFGKNYYE